MDWDNTLSAKNPFKSSIDALQVMLLNFKKLNTTKFLYAGLTALRTTVRPTSGRRMGPVFCHNASDHCLITHMLF